jgi:hypothetical protein
MDIKTKCKECVFRNGYDCQLGRHEFFSKNGAEIKKEEDYSVVSGRFCSALRVDKWAKHHNRYNLPIIVRSELLIAVEAIILINDNYSEEKLNLTLDNLGKQLLRPSKVVLNIQGEKLPIHSAMKILKKQSIPYRIDKVGSNNYHRQECIDVSAEKCTGTHLLILDVGQVLEDEEFIANIDEAINERLVRFVKIKETENRGPIYSQDIYKKLKGTYPMSEFLLNDEEKGDKDKFFFTIEEKLAYLCERDGHSLYVKTYEEING